MMRWRNPWRRRWTVATVGCHSGTERLLPFARFRTQEEAAAWAASLNASTLSDLIRFEARPLP